MLVLRCTKQVLGLFGEKPREVQVSGGTEGLGDWYVRLVDDGDCEGIFFLCTNAQTLYTLILELDAEGYRSISDLADRMLARLLEHLHRLGISKETLAQVAEDYSQVLIGKTASRSVLGSMNDLVNNLCFHTGQQMRRAGKLDLWAIEEALNTIPQRPVGWAFAKNSLIELCSRV